GRASNVSRPGPFGADQVDAEHEAPDLPVMAWSGGGDAELDHQGAVVADRRGSHPGATGPDDPGRVVAQDMVELLGRGGIREGPALSGLGPAAPGGHEQHRRG